MFVPDELEVRWLRELFYGAKEYSMADVMLSNDARCTLQSRPPLSHPIPEGGRAGGAGTTFARPLPGKA